MRQFKVSAYFGPIFIAMFLITSVSTQQLLHAQDAPAPGTTVTVKMIDTVDSSKDPAGKQYRASVTKAVTASDGVAIAQGSAATVTLTSSGSGYTAQLSSITVNGQPVAVTSNSASVSAVGQLVQSKAASAMGSMLGSFGHHVSAPASVAAAATGQHVSLPTGTTLTFVLGNPSASTPVTPAVAAAQPPASSPAVSSAPTPASGPATAATGRYVFCFTGQYANLPTDYHTNASEPVTYFSEVFPEPNIGLHVTVDWNDFLQKKSMPKGACQDANGLSVAQTRKQQREDEYRKEKKQIVETGWKYAPAEATATTAATATGSAAAPAAANEYYVWCNSPNLDGPMYFSDIFAFNQSPSPDARDVSAVLAAPFLQFLEKKYAVKDASSFYTSASWSGSNFPTQCSQSFPSVQEAQRDKQRIEDNFTKHLHREIVETGWKTTTVPLPAVTAPPAAANEYYLSCYSDTALPVQYFSDIFAAVPTGDPIRNAFLAFLQKKYGFNDTRPGPHVDCDESPKPANAAMFKSAWAVRQNRVSLAKGNQKQVVETGWKYTR